jgi:hypothetical protein
LLYKKFKSVPANTTPTSPDHEKLVVCKGIIQQWIIFFDPEAADMLHVRVEYHGSSIMPFGGKDWLVALFNDAPFNDNIALDAPPYELDIYAYNEDDTFRHEYYIYPIIIRDKPVELPTGEPSAIERFKKYITGE